VSEVFQRIDHHWIQVKCLTSPFRMRLVPISHASNLAQLLHTSSRLQPMVISPSALSIGPYRLIAHMPHIASHRLTSFVLPLGVASIARAVDSHEH
jgi:hypothetical protein